MFFVDISKSPPRKTLALSLISFSILFFKIITEEKISLFLVTHNINVAKKCDRVINLFDGQIKN